MAGMASRIVVPKSFAYGTAGAKTMGYWDSMRYVSKAETESYAEYFDRYKPSLMTSNIGAGLVVHRGQGEWDAPKLSKHLMWTARKTMNRQHLSFNGTVGHKDHIGYGRRTEFSGAKWTDAYVNDKMIEQVPHGMLRWSCPGPREAEEEPMVDIDWLELSSAFLEGRLGGHVHAVICRGPFDVTKSTPEFQTPLRSNREEYKFYVVTDTFYEREPLSELNYRLRVVDNRSAKGRWLNNNPLWQNYARWARLPHYHFPPTGGEVLTRNEAKNLLAQVQTREAHGPSMSPLGMNGTYDHKWKPIP